MKRFVSGLVFGLLFGVIVSCASHSGEPYKPLSGMPNVNVIGSVQTNFESRLEGFRTDFPKLNEAAYIALLEAAKRENYSGNIDIVDISWVPIKRANHITQYAANGKVVLFGSSSGALV